MFTNFEPKKEKVQNSVKLLLQKMLIHLIATFKSFRQSYEKWNKIKSKNFLKTTSIMLFREPMMMQSIGLHHLQVD